MSDRQQQMFMYQWSRWRARGPLGLAAIGAGVGALGGLAFTVAMMAAMAGQTVTLNEDELSPFVLAIGHVIGPAGLMLVMAAPSFAALGAFLAFRVFHWQEAMYQSMLAQGAQPPELKPMLTRGERWPLYAVIASALLMASFIVAIALLVH